MSQIPQSAAWLALSSSGGGDGQGPKGFPWMEVIVISVMAIIMILMSIAILG